MPRVAYEVFGHVQGVGFRMTATDIARHIGSLTGHVENTSRSTVTGEVQGTQEKVDKFIKALEQSPAGRVERVETKSVDEVQGERGFTN